MKPILSQLILLLPAALSCGCANTVTTPIGGRLVGPVDVPDSVNVWLSDQAKIIGFYTAVATDTNYLDTVELPEWAAKRVYNAIAILWNSKSLERDSIFNVYAIRERGDADFHTVLVCDFPDSLFIDILNRYQFVQDSSFSTTFLSSRLLNTFAIANQINVRVQFPNCASANMRGGEGDHVKAIFESGSVVLEYHMGWDDCQAGCLEHRTWQFRINEDGTVKFLGVTGDPPPPPNGR